MKIDISKLDLEKLNEDNFERANPRIRLRGLVVELSGIVKN